MALTLCFVFWQLICSNIHASDLLFLFVWTVSCDISAEGRDAYLKSDELELIAQHCNEQKLAAKGAQEKSDLIFLCALLRMQGPVDEVRI